jgi:hypothetical protein
MKLKAFLNKPEWKIAGLFYKVAYCKIIDEAATLGYCDSDAQVIYMKDGQEIDETFKPSFTSCFMGWITHTT